MDARITMVPLRLKATNDEDKAAILAWLSDTFHSLMQTADKLRAYRTVEEVEAQPVLISLAEYVVLIDPWTRSHQIDRDARLIMQERQQQARAAFNDISMRMPEKLPPPLDLLPMPKLIDREVAERLVARGLVDKLEDIYTELDPEEVIKIKAMQAEAVQSEAEYPQSRAWILTAPFGRVPPERFHGLVGR